jgi:hypothetical protein
LVQSTVDWRKREKGKGTHGTIDLPSTVSYVWLRKIQKIKVTAKYDEILKETASFVPA